MSIQAIKIAQEIESLPPEAQNQIIDFVAFLKKRYLTSESIQKSERGKLTDEPFIGMWRQREEMKDSAAWVREFRQREWEQRVQ